MGSGRRRKLANVVSQNRSKKALADLAACLTRRVVFARPGPNRPGTHLPLCRCHGRRIDFNTIYRDRNLAWPIQDLPCDLVFFCHRNPVDPIAFREDYPDNNPPSPMRMRRRHRDAGSSAYRDIVETIVTAAADDAGWQDQPDEICRRIKESHFPTGTNASVPRKYACGHRCVCGSAEADA